MEKIFIRKVDKYFLEVKKKKKNIKDIDIKRKKGYIMRSYLNAYLKFVIGKI